MELLVIGCVFFVISTALAFRIALRMLANKAASLETKKDDSQNTEE